MLQAFIIVSREGLEAFLIVAVIMTYLKKTNRRDLLPAVQWGIITSVLASIGMAFVLAKVSNVPLLEGVLGVVTAVLVATLIIHMWRLGPAFAKEMENKVSQASQLPDRKASLFGVFLLTVFLITREGMETALMLFQVKNGRFIMGSFLGLGGAALISWLWVRYSHLINLRRFFRITGVYLIFFMVQVLFTAFHEFSEAGVLPNSEAFHIATEPYAPDGMYGKWFSMISVVGLGLWLIVVAIIDKNKRRKQPAQNPAPYLDTKGVGG